MLDIFLAGTAISYGVTIPIAVTGGNYDDTTGILTVIEGSRSPRGQVNVVSKGITGILTSPGDQFWLSYQGCNLCS